MPGPVPPFANMTEGYWPLSLFDAALASGGITRALIPFTKITAASFISSGYVTAGDPGTGALYIRGTSSGLLAVADANGTWWNLSVTTYANVGWFGAKANGSTDDTAAGQLAFAAGKALGVPIVFPVGTTVVSSGFLIDWHNACVRGVSVRDSIVSFAPTSDGQILFDFYKAGDGNGLTYGSLTDLCIVATGSHIKTAVSWRNTSLFKIADVNIQGWTGSGSDIGIAARGRELTTMQRVSVVADRPVLLGLNPDRASFLNIDNDHLHAQDTFLIVLGGAGPNIVMETGVNLTRIDFDGYQSWNGGTAGVDWEDTTATIPSIGIAFRNVRFEQGAPGSFMFKITRTGSTKVYDLLLDSCNSSTQGAYLRKVYNTTISSLAIESTGYGIDADGASCATLDLIGCRWPQGSLGNLPNFAPRQATGRLDTPSIAALPTSAQYVSTSLYPGGLSSWSGPKSINGSQAQPWHGCFSIASGGAASGALPPFVYYAVNHALIMVSSDQGQHGVVGMGSGALQLVSGTSSFAVGSTGGKLCVVFNSGSDIEIVNNLAGAAEVTVSVIPASAALV